MKEQKEIKRKEIKELNSEIGVAASYKYRAALFKKKIF